MGNLSFREGGPVSGEPLKQLHPVRFYAMMGLLVSKACEALGPGAMFYKIQGGDLPQKQVCYVT